ncbi:hypothetical protein [Kitasatospora griseola]|uniref:hypothetical protein n=1 Tax=Kitasatospora griseola TaxID=2064 RepID=UPI00344411FB
MRLQRLVREQRQLPPQPRPPAGPGELAQYLVDPGSRGGVVAQAGGRFQGVELGVELVRPTGVRGLHTEHGGQAAGAQQR